MLGRLHLVLLRASDLERSARFYRDLIGVGLQPGDNRRPGDPWIGGTHHEYSWRDGYLHFSVYPGSIQEHTSGAHIGFQVADVRAMHQRLVEAGVPVLLRLARSHGERPPVIRIQTGTSSSSSNPDGSAATQQTCERRFAA